MIVLDHVLLDDSVTTAHRGGLLDGRSVEVSLGDESIVAGNMRGGLGRAHGELMVLIALRFAIRWQLVARVVTVRAKRLLELSLEVATLGGVSLSVIRPKRSF